MSGYKHATVTISEAEYRRLHDAEMKGRFSRVVHNETKKDRQETKIIKAGFRAFEERQHEFQQYIGTLENEIGQIEIETSQALVEHQKEFQQDLDVHLASLQENTTNILNEAAQDLSLQIEDNQRKHLRQLIHLKRHFDALSVNIEQKASISKNWLDTTVALRNFIEEHYDHNRFMPGYFERLDTQIQQAIENLQNNMAEAALVGLQQVYMDCSQARLELERVTNEWQMLFQAARESVEELFSYFNSNKVIPALDTLGRELPIEIILDQWSDNRCTALINHARGLYSHLETNMESLTCKELTELTESIVPGLKNEFNSLVYEARLAVIYSQFRINIADIAIQALERQGFNVYEFGFVDNNMRKPYNISLRNIGGSQVKIQVNPIRSLEAASDLEIESMDTLDLTESELRSRSQEILRSLTRYGLRVGPVNTNRRQEIERIEPIKMIERIPARSMVQQDSHHD